MSGTLVSERALLLTWLFLAVDGRDITPLREKQIREECAKIRAKGISGVVVVGVFSPLDTVALQEQRTREIILEEIPGADVVMSRDSKCAMVTPSAVLDANTVVKLETSGSLSVKMRPY